MNNTEEELHWWLVSYTYFPENGGQGFGSYVQGTNLKFFNKGVLDCAKEKASKEVGVKVALTSISYLGKMTKEIALGDLND